MTIYVSVNKHIIAENAKGGPINPPYELRNSKTDTQPFRIYNAEFQGKVKLVYDMNNPLISGAACWLEIDEFV